jgi:heme oxygenase
LTVREELKAATASLHERLERHVHAAGHLDDLGRYADLLARFHACYAPLEQRLSRLDWCQALPDAEQRLVKAGWLAQDLERLGAPGRPRAPSPRLALPEDVDEGLGCLYVLEGATLGGAIVSRHVAQRLGLSPERGARFFHGYGEARGLLWRRFLGGLGARAWRPGARERLVQAACATFAGFLAALTERDFSAP